MEQLYSANKFTIERIRLGIPSHCIHWNADIIARGGIMLLIPPSKNIYRHHFPFGSQGESFSLGWPFLSLQSCPSGVRFSYGWWNLFTDWSNYLTFLFRSGWGRIPTVCVSVGGRGYSRTHTLEKYVCLKIRLDFIGIAHLILFYFTVRSLMRRELKNKLEFWQ